jgi:hypothetical protein
MFNKRLSIMIAASTLVLSLSACSKDEAPAADATQQVAEVITVPPAGSPPADWKKYLAAVVTENMQGVKTNHPYMYFVPGGDDGKAVVDRSNQLDNVTVTVQRGVLPGNMLAFGGPQSSVTADLISDSFKEAGPGTFKDVTVLFVGAQVDSDRVKEALAPSGATYRFAEMK